MFSSSSKKQQHFFLEKSSKLQQIFHVLRGSSLVPTQPSSFPTFVIRNPENVLSFLCSIFVCQIQCIHNILYIVIIQKRSWRWFVLHQLCIPLCISYITSDQQCVSSYLQTVFDSANIPGILPKIHIHSLIRSIDRRHNFVYDLRRIS